jgi:hypothetical protein
MSAIIRFPNRVAKRLAARRPRSSKNGTPEERLAKAGPAAFRSVPFKPRRSKNGTPEERAAKLPPQAAVIDLAPERALRLMQLCSTSLPPAAEIVAETPTESEA